MAELPSAGKRRIFLQHDYCHSNWRAQSDGHVIIAAGYAVTLAGISAPAICRRTKMVHGTCQLDSRHCINSDVAVNIPIVSAHRTQLLHNFTQRHTHTHTHTHRSELAAARHEFNSVPHVLQRGGEEERRGRVVPLAAPQCVQCKSQPVQPHVSSERKMEFKFVSTRVCSVAPHGVWKLCHHAGSGAGVCKDEGGEGKFSVQVCVCCRHAVSV
ncbi:hypothetical protein LSM04_007572 [Trypanosoma melophagium]|uniref:uncharacterized protein n=1 Tax=Trypanosoma melophagium TaxID=715481 RepID=UPI00351A272A|nr:hypothetical protein LSM04_007572 [Trypanosoma melophagium]